jgi:hypothetical protein
MAGGEGFEPMTFSLEAYIPECCELGFFFPGKPYVPFVETIWMCRGLGHKHALPIDTPMVFDAVFTFKLGTYHLEYCTP